MANFMPIPATQFCCGCSLACGAKFIMLINLALNVGLVVIITSHLVFESGLKSAQVLFNDYNTEMWCLAFSLVGIPLICMAYHGVLYRNEVQVQVYFWYMLTVFTILLAISIWNFLFNPICDNLPSIVGIPSQPTAALLAPTELRYVRKLPGSAWACGVARYIHIITLVLVLSILGYFTHVVGSFCEDLSFAPGAELQDLVVNKEAYAQRYQPQGENAYPHIRLKDQTHPMAGFTFGGMVGGAAANMYGQSLTQDDLSYCLASRQYGRQSAPERARRGESIFGQKYHELSFPPNPSGEVQSV